MMRKIFLLLASILIAAAPVVAQNQPTAKVHGHIQDPTGAPLTDAIVTLSTDGGKTAKYTFNANPSSDYSGEVAPGTYTFSLRRPDTPADKVIDQFSDVKIPAGGDVTQDFDMTRPAYLASMTAEQRKQAEEVRKRNAEANKENAVIKNLNANLAKARADNDPKTPNYAEAESLMAAATQAKPEEAILWLELGISQFHEKKYDDAITSLKKAADLSAASKKPDSAKTTGAAYDYLGQTYAAAGKAQEAQDAFAAGASANPPGAAGYYYNEAVVFRNKNNDVVAAAADKTIAADPTGHPIAYYLKGEALIATASVDPKTNKIIAPPGCAEAYQKYLELQPTGPYANDAKAILDQIGTTVTTTYKASKKK